MIIAPETVLQIILVPGGTRRLTIGKILQFI